MSKYSDRHQNSASRAHSGCLDPGNKLEVRNGVLNWFCERHVSK